MIRRPGLAVVVPIEPAATGNGLAMRVDGLVRAASVDHEVHLVVVPVAGPAAAAGARPELASRRVVEPGDPTDPRGLVALVAEASWRDRWERTAPVPPAAAAALPTAARPVAGQLAGRGVIGVLTVRLTLAPFGLALAEALGVPLVIDADDDDQRLQQDLGHRDLAAAFGRLAAVYLPAARRVLAASAVDASALTRRHTLRPPAEVVPNIAPTPALAPTSPPGDGEIVFVANFTYPPNAHAARWLVGEVLSELEEGLSLQLVGAAGPDLEALGGGRVVVHGTVAEVASHYRDADVAVVPLLHGGGSRIKVLEAFAHRRPVVATSIGVAGLDVEPGIHALVHDDPVEFARAIAAARSPLRRADLVVAAAELVRHRYAADVVSPATAGMLRATFA